MIFSYIRYITKRALMFIILGIIILGGAAYGLNKITANTKQDITIENTTNKQAQIEQKSDDQINQERQNEFTREDKERLDKQEADRVKHNRDNSKASEIWTDDNGKNVVQPNIDKEQQKIKDGDKDAVNTNPSESGKSFLGDDIK